MTETADVVIIGSGIVGSSVAYHLAQQGCTNVLVIEREPHQGKGSTGKSMGGVRAQFSTPVNIQMSRYSIDFFARFDEVVGHPADYRAHGYLFARQPNGTSNISGQIASCSWPWELRMSSWLRARTSRNLCRNCASTTYSAERFAKPTGSWIRTA